MAKKKEEMGVPAIVDSVETQEIIYPTGILTFVN